MTDFASLCLLSFNRPRFIEQAIQTIRANSAYPFELIVHDDGSDLETQELLFEMVSSGLISSLILNPGDHNQGQGIALNRMFTMAKGDPIVKLDQDLIFHPGWLAHVVGLLDSNREVSGPEHDPARRREPRIGLLGTFHYWLDPCDSNLTKLEQFEGWSSRTHILGSGFAVTRECWEELGPFPEHYESFGEDWEFQKRVTADPRFVCGLPDQDLVTNQGFGIGPSTVVVAPDTVAHINKEPVIYR